MELKYRILNLYKTRQYNECLKLSETALRGKNDRMLEFVCMRAITIQAKIALNGYEEVDYYAPQNELTSSTVAKTPRPGTSFVRNIKMKTAQNVDFSWVSYYVSNFLLLCSQNIFNQIGNNNKSDLD